MLTFLLLAGYVPLTICALAFGMYLSSRGNHSAGAQELGDRVGRRSGYDRRVNTGMSFVGAGRRSSVDRRGAVAATEADRVERVA